LKSKNIKSIAYSDTALAAKYIKQSSEKWLSAICSEKAANLHWLNILDKNIADQKWNTTVFVIIVTKDSNIKYNKKSTKTSLIFEAKNIPASLYKCLWVFAKNNINLTKIESLPSFKWKFSYFFWISFEWILQEQSIIIALEELKQYTNRIRILWEH
jgi:prephenate dehydratase